MDRYAIFVDAGYFFAAGAQATFGSQIPRKQLALKSPPAMLSDLCSRTSAVAGDLQLLRVYWYDAMPGPHLSLQQSELAMLPGLKLRLGALNGAGEQKGVDSLIVTDIIDLARNRAIVDAVVVTGDEDLRIAVQVAQTFGVRVHILAAGDPLKNVSPSLQMEADSVTALDADWFSKHLEPISSPQTTVATTVPSPGTATIDDVADLVIGEIIAGMTQVQLTQLVSHFSSSTSIPPEYDRPLVAKVCAGLSNRRLTGAETRGIRGQFVRNVKAAQK